MSEGEAALVIPARITPGQLAERIGKTITEVEGVLRARDQPDSTDDVLGGETATEVAATLGVKVTVEPRDLALERLYEYESRGELEADVGGRAGAIVEGVVSDLEELDGLIESVSEHWSVARMPVIDRNILRIGLHELRAEPATPTAVVIAEGVRLAQTYSTEKSAAFVNGVLATLARTIRES